MSDTINPHPPAPPCPARIQSSTRYAALIEDIQNQADDLKAYGESVAQIAQKTDVAASDFFDYWPAQGHEVNEEISEAIGNVLDAANALMQAVASTCVQLEADIQTSESM